MSDKQHKKLLEYESKDMVGIGDYSYSPLPPERNRIRLLRLAPGVLDNKQIDCEMFEAEFDGDGLLRHIGNSGPMRNKIKHILSSAKLQDVFRNLSSKESPREGATSSGPEVSSNDGKHADDASSSSSKYLFDFISKNPGEWLQKHRIIDFPLLKSVLNDIIISDTTPNIRLRDDMLDSSKLKKVLSSKTLNDIINTPELIKVLNQEEKKVSSLELQAILNEAKLDEILKSARLGKKISYEALSWRWGDEKRSSYTIMIKKSGFLYKKRVSETLGLALKHLRLNRDRIIWVDAICINQNDDEELSFQVSLMSLVYTGAAQICVWLGEEDEDSTKAIKFVREEISQLKNFDKICTDRQHSQQWKALLAFMQRPWFSRRWVVQEIALADKAEVYCGPDQISWVDLAIAVELFVEVETATHRLSELMKKDDVVPYWFEHVSELGASVLVGATARIFREHKGGGYGPVSRNSGVPASTNERSISNSPDTQSGPARKGPVRRSLLSLEYLVTSLSIFDCRRPHDSIYALIAIARDAAPRPPSSRTKRTKEDLITEVFSDALEQKPYPLDYNSPYPDVCKEFLLFCIKGAAKADKVQALNILCRPWAKDWRPNEYSNGADMHSDAKSRDAVKEEPEKSQVVPPKWKIKQVKTQVDHNLKSTNQGKEKAEDIDQEAKQKNDPNQDKKKPDEHNQNGDVNDPRTMKEYFDEGKKNFVPLHLAGAHEGAPYVPASQLWFKNPNPGQDGDQGHGKFRPRKISDLGLPSWVNTIDKAAFDIFPHPGMDMVKMGRKNADPLVGVPQDGRRNYNACQLIGVDLNEVKFRRRARLGHYSLYVKGFCFDRVEVVSHVSQAGTIPAAWLDLGDWSEARRTKGPYDDTKDPPDEFWRTLVADRGMHDQNPPYYYMRACKETIMKGGLRSNAVDTSALIFNERNSIVAEFCRRVQSVIWNRALIRTEQNTLGLAPDGVRTGDWVCLIYGCTVPVILRKHAGLKSQREYDREVHEDRIEALTRCMHKAAKGKLRKARYTELAGQKKDTPWAADVQDKLKKFDDLVKAKLQKEKEEIFEKLRRHEEKSLGQKSDARECPAWTQMENQRAKILTRKEVHQIMNPTDESDAQRPKSSEMELSRAAGPKFSDEEELSKPPDIESAKSEAINLQKPDVTKPGDLKPEDNQSGDTDHENPDDTKPEEPDDTKPDGTKPDGTKPEEPDDTKPEKPDDIGSERNPNSADETSDTEQYEESSESENDGDWAAAENRKRRQKLAEMMDPFRHYTFIGESYIHGMMDGEAVRQKFYKGKPDHMFELR